MIHIYTSLKEVIDATTKFISETRESDIKRTSPEKILNLFIAANRFGREAIAACCRKIYGNDYETSRRNDSVSIPSINCWISPWLARHYTNRFIVLKWDLFFYGNIRYIIEVIAHEIAHDIVNGHSEAFWREYYKNCQILGLISEDIPFEKGMQSWDVKGHGHIKNFNNSGDKFRFLQFYKIPEKIKAISRLDMFIKQYNNKLEIRTQAIKKAYINIVYDLCKEYHVDPKSLDMNYPAAKFIDSSPTIDEPWLIKPEMTIIDSCAMC